MKTKIILNEDTNIVQMIRDGLRANGGYCPCAVEKSADTKCMCKEFREQEDGYCHCGLYCKIKVEDTANA